MRVPGFLNRKHSPAPVVAVEYGAASALYGPGDFPTPAGPPDGARERFAVASLASGVDTDIVERARRYLAAIPPAVAGQHGDAQTFRVCCRLARGFALEPSLALRVIAEWNDRCEPPWTERELIAKLDHARRYGREPIGALLGVKR
jgi:hypothetical protein